MRISLVSDTYLPEINGVTTVLSTMREGLLTRGQVVQIVAPYYPRGAVADPGIVRLPSIPCPLYPAVRLSWPWARRLGALLAEFKPDLVHVATEGPLGWYGRRWALKRGLPLVTSFHTDFPRYAERYIGARAAALTRRYLRWFHRPALHTQTPSEISRDELLGLGLPRAMVWGRGVDTAHFHPNRRRAARRLALGVADKVMVLHVGRLAVEKDVDTLIAAFRLAHEALGDTAAFLVAGGGPREADVRRELPFVTHLGFLDRQTIADVYADADLFVFPSSTETCGLVALEALASGLPVVGADAGGVRSSVRHGLTGALVPAGDAPRFSDAIADLVRDGSKRDAMSQAARAFAVGRDWSRELDGLVELYARAVGLEGEDQLGGSSAPAATALSAPMSWPTSTSVR